MLFLKKLRGNAHTAIAFAFYLAFAFVFDLTFAFAICLCNLFLHLTAFAFTIFYSTATRIPPDPLVALRPGGEEVWRNSLPRSSRSTLDALWKDWEDEGDWVDRAGW